MGLEAVAAAAGLATVGALAGVAAAAAGWVACGELVGAAGAAQAATNTVTSNRLAANSKTLCLMGTPFFTKGYLGYRLPAMSDLAQGSLITQGEHNKLQIRFLLRSASDP
jgi:hypothetical protein